MKRISPGVISGTSTCVMGLNENAVYLPGVWVSKKLSSKLLFCTAPQPLSPLPTTFHPFSPLFTPFLSLFTVHSYTVHDSVILL